MAKDTNIIDIAKYAGVSVSTVSRVLNNHPDVSPKTRAKVMETIKNHSYIPNNSARNLKRESMRAVAVVVKGFTNPFFTNMLTVIQQQLDENRYTMLLHQVDYKEDEVAAAISLCKEKKPRGLIFMGGNFRHSRAQLSHLDVPYVMLTITMHRDVDRAAFSSVTVDDYAAGVMVAEYVYKAGHRRVAAIGSNANDVSISALRIDGFLKALQDKGVYDKDVRVAYAGAFSRKAGYDAAKQLLRDVGDNGFTCLFCISDTMALGAMRAFYEAGMNVPGDISVIGFDGIEAGRYSVPSLATVKQPDIDMAHKSVDILMDRLRKGSAHQHLVFEPTILEGESFLSLGVAPF